MTKTMEQARLWVMAVACGIATVSCGGQTPTSPAVGGSPSFGTVSGQGAQASGETIRLRFSVALTVPAYPICALTPASAGELTGTGVLTVLIRLLEDGSGGTHIGSEIVGHGTAIDVNGERWVWSDADHNNEVLGLPTGNTSGNSFSETRRENFHVIGPKGQQIMVTGTFHITNVNGNTVVELETGNHEDNEICESGFALTPLP